jgi:hypothetical protein
MDLGVDVAARTGRSVAVDRISDFNFILNWSKDKTELVRAEAFELSSHVNSAGIHKKLDLLCQALLSHNDLLAKDSLLLGLCKLSESLHEYPGSNHCLGEELIKCGLEQFVHRSPYLQAVVVSTTGCDTTSIDWLRLLDCGVGERVDSVLADFPCLRDVWTTVPLSDMLRVIWPVLLARFAANDREMFDLFAETDEGTHLVPFDYLFNDAPLLQPTDVLPPDFVHDEYETLAYLPGYQVPYHINFRPSEMAARQPQEEWRDGTMNYFDDELT